MKSSQTPGRPSGGWLSHLAPSAVAAEPLRAPKVARGLRRPLGGAPERAARRPGRTGCSAPPGDGGGGGGAAVEADDGGLAAEAAVAEVAARWCGSGWKRCWANKLQWTKPPMGGPSSSPRREGASPPSTRGGGLVYGRMRDGSGPTGLGNGSPIGGLGLK